MGAVIDRHATAMERMPREPRPATVFRLSYLQFSPRCPHYLWI